MATQDACIIDACKQSWDGEFIPGMKNSNNCSGFVKAVLGKLGIPIPSTATADGIMDAIAGWSKLKSGADAAHQAEAGNLVIAGLKSAAHSPARTNGHVVIVIGGKLYKDLYPLCWSGSIGGAQSQGTKSVGEVWNRTDRSSVGYFVYGVTVCRNQTPSKL